MKICSFSQFSPGGNLTLFLQEECPPLPLRAKICKKAMKAINAEQAAFVDFEKHILTMAGDEFCINATLAFGALLDFQVLRSEQNEARIYTVEVSGLEAPIELHVDGTEPLWQVEAILPMPEFRLNKIDSGISIVELPGISHLLMRIDRLPSPEEGASLGPQYIKKHRLEFEQAAGVIWFTQNEEGLNIMPFVAVPEAGTAMLESSCGSGSLALALSLGKEQANYKIGQPSGACLNVNIADDKVSISGEVLLLSSGELWLDIECGY